SSAIFRLLLPCRTSRAARAFTLCTTSEMASCCFVGTANDSSCHRSVSAACCRHVCTCPSSHVVGGPASCVAASAGRPRRRVGIGSYVVQLLCLARCDWTTGNRVRRH